MPSRPRRALAVAVDPSLIASERPRAPDTSIKNPDRVRHRRAALVQAAIDVFSAKGYHASRVSDVAQAAGISQGSVYNYVNSKEDLLFMVCEDHFLGYERIVSTAMAGVIDPRDRLETLLRATIEAIFSYRKHYLVMLRELHHVERNRRRAFMRLAAAQRKICEDILCDIAREEGLDVGNSLITANLMIFLPSFIISRGWDLRGKVDDAEVADTLVEFMRCGLGSSKKLIRRRTKADRERAGWGSDGAQAGAVENASTSPGSEPTGLR